MMDTTFHITVTDEDLFFSQADAPRVVREYVCAVCWGQLTEYFIPHSPLVLIACPEHGNVTDCGRIMNSTASIETENAYRRYNDAIRNLADLWPEQYAALGNHTPLREGETTKERNLRELGF